MRKSMLSITFLVPVTAYAAPAAAPVSLVQNEYDFVTAVADAGIRDGFLQYLDKRSIVFSPKPVNGYDTYTARKPGGSTQLKWYPSFALVAASGDFGVDTGPWLAEWSKDGKPQQAYGEWLTIWSKDAEGRWKALFDSGIDHPKPQALATPLERDVKVAQLPASAGAPPAEADAHDALTRAEAAFTSAANGGSLRGAYDAAGTDDIRVLMEEGQPLLGKAMADKVVPAVPAGLVWVPMGGSSAKSGDLGYTYGMTYAPADTAYLTPKGTYMHVWKHDVTGWKLIIALESPLPADTK